MSEPIPFAALEKLLGGLGCHEFGVLPRDQF
jgi:hypothetical protein